MTRFTKSVRIEVNKRGGTTLYTIGCVGCGKRIEWTDQTAAEVIDKVIPYRSQLPIVSVPALVQPEPEVSEEQQQKRSDYERRKIDDVLGYGPEPSFDPRWYPPATIFEDRHALELSMVCEINRLLRVRGKGQ